MATLLSKVRDVTKSTLTETPDIAVGQFLQSAANFVVASIPKELLRFLGADGSAITDDNGQAVTNVDEVLQVRRKDIICDEVPASLSNQLDIPGSIYVPTTYFPVYFVRGGLIFIKPAPTAGSPGLVTTIKAPTINETTTDTAITYRHIESPILNYARALDFTALANYYSNLKTATLGSSGGSTDALAKAEALIDTQSGVGGDPLGKSVQSWITAEDAEMAVTTIQAAAQEVQRAMAEISKGKEYDSQVQLFFQKADAYFKQAQLEIANFINANSKIIKMKQQASQEN